MYAVNRLDIEDQGAPPAPTAAVLLTILSAREPVALVTFILMHPAGRSYPIVTSDVDLDEHEQEAVRRWLGGRLPELDIGSARFETNQPTVALAMMHVDIDRMIQEGGGTAIVVEQWTPERPATLWTVLRARLRARGYGIEPLNAGYRVTPPPATRRD
jgi:hypothetical protein